MTKDPHDYPGKQAMQRLMRQFFANCRGEPTPPPPPPDAAAKDSVETDFQMLDLIVPVMPPRGRPGRQVTVNLSDQQAAALASVFDGLRSADARLTCGRTITTSADAIRWLLEEIFGTWSACTRRPKKTTRQARRRGTQTNKDDR